MNNNNYNPNLQRYANNLRHTMTKAEACLWKYALRAGKIKGYTFRRQRPILDFIVDFVCLDLKLIIEVDGYTHSLDEVIKKDQIKQKALESAGFCVIRFSDKDILQGMNHVIATIEYYVELQEKKLGIHPLPPHRLRVASFGEARPAGDIHQISSTRGKYRSFLIIIAIVIASTTIAQKPAPKYVPPETRILFIFDASQSMAGPWEKETKIAVARRVLIDMIDSLEQVPNVKMALRIYGHQSPVPPQNCSDTKLEVPFAKGNAGMIRQQLRFVVPKGTTPIARSLAAGGDDFPPDVENCRNLIILITDGVEACDGDACAVSAELQKKGITLKPFVIGIGIDENFVKSFSCIGNFYNAQYEEKLTEVMDVVIDHALDATTAQINLLDANGMPTESNVNCTLYDQNSGKILYNYIHTLNHRGLPDTLILDQLPTYRMRVNTIPPVDVDNIKLQPGRHTIIAAQTPQGKLVVKTSDNGQYRNIEYIVRKAGDMQTVNVQRMYAEERYLVGKYDVEIPILPRRYIYGVEIKQSSTTTIDVPRPGMVTLLRSSTGYGSIYLRKSNLDEEWVCNLDNYVKSESLQLQPGSYRVVFRAVNAKQTLYTVNKTFDIRSGSSTVVQLY